MVVGALLPARRPDQLVDLRQAQQRRPPIGDAVRHPVDQVKAGRGARPSGPSKPNRLITPSTSTASTGRLVPGRTCACAMARASVQIAPCYHSAAVPSTNQLIRKGRKPPQKKVATPGLKSGPGAQAPHRRAPAPRRLHARLHRDAEEAELRPSQGRPRPAHQRHGGHLLHPRRGAQPPGALRRPRQGGRVKDLPGVRYKVIRGTLDASGVSDRKQSRSMYGVRPLKPFMPRRARAAIRPVEPDAVAPEPARPAGHQQGHDRRQEVDRRADHL